VFWGVPVILPVILYWNIRDSRADPEPLPDGGIPWLALPLEITGRPSPTSRWRGLQQRHPLKTDSPPALPQRREEAPVPVARTAASSGGSFRIRMHGHLGEGLDKVYLFFDTDSGRWFRLMTGEVDREAGVALRLSDKTEGVKLVDLDGGREYAVREGEDLLARVLQ
ncbi:MAG: hypothetical protein R6V45_00480, partial [Oceanipulchritudo sp.]